MSGQEGGSPWRALGGLVNVGMTLVVATALGLWFGLFLDRTFRTSPWLTLIFLFFGIAAGFVNLFRAVTRAEQSEKNGTGPRSN